MTLWSVFQNLVTINDYTQLKSPFNGQLGYDEHLTVALPQKESQGFRSSGKMQKQSTKLPVHKVSFKG